MRVCWLGWMVVLAGICCLRVCLVTCDLFVALLEVVFGVVLLVGGGFAFGLIVLQCAVLCVFTCWFYVLHVVGVT